MLEDLKQQVWAGNLALWKSGLVTLTWGNVSGFDRNRSLMAIKPSGVAYDDLRPEHIVLVDLNGDVVEGQLKPSSDTPTHLELYRAFSGIQGAAHTHSAYATAFAQACREIPCLGTTHADQFRGPVPLTRVLTEAEVREAYELQTGRVIAECFRNLDPVAVPGALVAYHGPFTWGETPCRAVDNSIALEAIARMAHNTLALAPPEPMPQHLLEKHHTRKHGPDAYYGQVR